MNGRYIDPKETRMFLQFKVLSETGANVEETDNVSMVNSIAQSFIKDIQVYVNHKLESSLTNSDCNYKSYLEYCLSYNATTIDRMKSSIFIMDNEDKFDIVTKVMSTDAAKATHVEGQFKKDDTRNEGFLKRRRLLKGGTSIQAYTTFPCDFFQTLKYIPVGFAYYIIYLAAISNIF